MRKRESFIQVSIVIPTYNRAQTIGRAVESAFGQKCVRVEVIVVDDGSLDETPVVLRSLQERYGPSLQVHWQANAGASAARNAGLELARGDYVQFLDSDDTLDPNKLRSQLEKFDEDPSLPVVLCYGWLEEYLVERRIGEDLGEEPQPYIEAMCGKAVHVIQTSAPLWRRLFLGSELRWDPSISLGDDLEFHARCLAKAERVSFVHEPLFKVNWHQGDRLSNFSTNQERLASLFQTRVAIYEALVAQGKWNSACARNSAIALRSLYLVYLQRMTLEEVRFFEENARRICKTYWSGLNIKALSLIRRVCGKTVADMAVGVGLLARENVGRARRLPIAIKRRIRGLMRFNIREELISYKSSQARALIRPNSGTVLYVELNNFHAEIVPGYVALLSAAGFRTVVLHRYGLDVEGACSRLPADMKPLSFPMSLRGIRQFLRGKAVEGYVLVVVGSGTLAEPSGFWGGALDYVGMAPKGKAGHLVIVHNATVLADQHHTRTLCNLFALRDMQIPGQRLPMLAPVEFGPVALSNLSAPVRLGIIGRFDPSKRDVSGLFAAIRHIVQTQAPTFEIHLIGESNIADIPEDIRYLFRAHGQLSFQQMYNELDKTHFLLSLLDSQTEAHRIFLRYNTTGTRQLSLGFCTPLIMDSEFAEIYDFDEAKAIIHAPGQLQDGLFRAITLSATHYIQMQTALKTMKLKVEATSLANLWQHLDRSANLPKIGAAQSEGLGAECVFSYIEKDELNKC